MTNLNQFLENSVIVQLAHTVSIQNKVKEWFEYLGNPGNVDGNRFLICIGIDLKYNLLEETAFLKIFEKLDYSKPIENWMEQFDWLIHNERDTYFKHSNCASCNYPRERYVTVRTWSKLFDKIKYYLPVAGKDTTLSEDDIDLVFNRVFNERTMGLEDVKEWSGWKYLTWLLPYKEFMEILNKFSGKKQIDYVMDTLGLEPNKKVLGTGDWDIPIYIEYPDDFNIESYQPTTLCGFWLKPGGLYLSYKNEDGFGRTFSTTSGNNNAKERVISEKEYGNEKFVPHIIGYPDGTLSLDRKNIVTEALNRFKDGK